MLLTDEAKTKAASTLRGLTSLGARWIYSGVVPYLNIETMPRLGGAKALRFAQLVRQAAVLEACGALVPNTDRMGKVVGWHLTDRAPTPVPVH